VIQKRVIYCDWVRGVGGRGEPGRLSWGNQLFGRPDVVRGGLCAEVSPVGGFSSFDGLKVAELGLSYNAVGVRGPEFFGCARGFPEFLSQSGKERGPPGFRFGDGREQGALASIAVVSMERVEENHWSSWLGEGGEGGEGRATF